MPRTRGCSCLYQFLAIIDDDWMNNFAGLVAEPRFLPPRTTDLADHRQNKYSIDIHLCCIVLHVFAQLPISRYALGQHCVYTCCALQSPYQTLYPVRRAAASQSKLWAGAWAAPFRPANFPTSSAYLSTSNRRAHLLWYGSIASPLFSNRDPGDSCTDPSSPDFHSSP